MEELGDFEDFLEPDDRPEIKNLTALHKMLLAELLQNTTLDTEIDNGAVVLCLVGSKNHCGGDVHHDYIMIDGAEIKQGKGGLFTVTDLHGEYDVFSCSGNDVIDFFVGIYAAFESDFNPDTPESFFNKGFKMTMRGLFSLEESNSSHSRNLN